MTKERIKAKLNIIESVMDVYESWFLSGDTQCLANMHDLVARPLLDEIEEPVSKLDADCSELKMRFAAQMLRSMTCCRLFRELNISTTMLPLVAANGDLHVASMVMNARRIEAASRMADDVLALGEEWDSLVEGESYGRLMRIFRERLAALKEEAENEIAEFNEHRTEAEQSEDLQIDEFALKQHEDQLNLCSEILADLDAWLADNPELDPGVEFLSEKDDEDDEDDEGEKGEPKESDESGDGDCLHGIGVAILSGDDLFRMLFGKEEEEEEEDE